jgi:predicted HicB family RNase H-like nuclease
MGRPPKAPNQRQSKMVAVRVTPAERKELEAAAKRLKLSLTDYLRKKLELRRSDEG